MSKTLIHTALPCEAQAVINHLNLKQDDSVQNLPQNCKLYSNENIIVLISGSGKNNTLEALNFIFENFEINKAINIGVAGCSDSSVKIGTLLCTNRFMLGINLAPITTVDAPLQSDEDLDTLLVDMEAKYFLEVAKQHTQDVTVLKVVSDYLDIETPKEAFVTELIQNSLPKWESIL